MEENYAFRKELETVHRKDRRDFALRPLPGETEINNTWTLFFEDGLDTEYADLSDYFSQSMGICLKRAETPSSKQIRVSVTNSGPARGFHFSVSGEIVKIRGNDSAGAAAGCYHLEDLLNLREAPFLSERTYSKTPLFSPRMVHSGWGMDQFPSGQLALAAHCGYDSILVFAKGPDTTPLGKLDFNDLVRRAAKVHLKVYFYSYLNGWKHPDEPDADEYFDRVYGSLFRHVPDAAGIILVGESCSFPSKDPKCSGREPGGLRSPGELGDVRQPPGFWPCSDYPQWLNAVKRAVRKYSPSADIVFWTYNWGRAPEKDRLDLLRNLPPDITVESTFEMFETQKYPRHTMIQSDYSITFPGPGKVFTSEAKCASAHGNRVYAMTNTAGRTWDFGVIPFVPAIYQWFKRFEALRNAHEKWNLRGLMECHHFGWVPSIVSECAKECFYDGNVNPEDVLKGILKRDLGEDAVPHALRALRFLSDAMDSYTPGFDDQAGPLRCGPAYPFILHPVLYPGVEHDMVFPTTENSLTKAAWIHTFYFTESVQGQSWIGRRIHEDLKILQSALKLWENSMSALADMKRSVPEAKLHNAQKLSGVMEFCYRSFLTLYRTKQWWLLNRRLEIEDDMRKAKQILKQLSDILSEERENVLAAIPLAEADSRLGWEPSMDYICDAEHLRWKLRQIDNVRTNILPEYKKTISVRPE